MAKKVYVTARGGNGEILPDGYKEIEHVTFDGNQWLNTGIVPDSDTSVIYCFTPKTIDGKYRSLVGAKITDTESAFFLSFAAAEAYIGFGNNNAKSIGKVINANVRYEVVQDKNGVMINGTLYKYNTSPAVLANGIPIHVGVQYVSAESDYSRTFIGDAEWIQIKKNGDLVANYIPCVDPNGNVGFYESVSGSFETCDGTGKLSAGPLVDATKEWRLARQLYISVLEDENDPNGIARRVRKGYVSIGRVARPFWGSDLERYGVITPMSVERCSLATGNAGGRLLFAGGYKYSYNVTKANVSAYDASLSMVEAEALGTARCCLAGGSVGDYALFAGGSTKDELSNGTTNVDAYDKNLTRSIPATLDAAAMEPAAANVADFLIIAGGTYTAKSVAYGEGLVKSSIPDLSVARGGLAGASNGKHAIFVGGYTGSVTNAGGTRSAAVDAYTDSLTKISVPDLPYTTVHHSGANIVGYAVFAGGRYCTKAMAYDRQLTAISVSELSEARFNMGVASIKDYALFVGGYTITDGIVGVVDVYDTLLTRYTISGLNEERYGLAGGSVGDNALFAGGAKRAGGALYSSANVDAYVAR